MANHGGPEALGARDISVETPGYGEIRIRQTTIGVNYIDVYGRTGYFDLIKPPGVLGMEAAGVIESIGPDVHDYKEGDRVAYACAPPGSYTDFQVMKSDFIVPVPEFLNDEQVAASLLKGITVGFLLHAKRFFAAVESGNIKIERPRVFALSDARAAHQAIESRSGIGSIILQTKSK